LFITGEGRDGVAIVYPYRSEVALTTPSGRAPGVMAVSTAPDYLFIANPQAGSVTILDIDTRKVLAVTMVGAEPAALAITPGQQYALVCNRGSGDLGVIRIAAITPGRAKSAPLFTLIPVGAAPVAVVVTA
jgi:YVTN family beta-propeller protein